MKFYVTTAIAYVNDRPGLHHGYEFAGADALARFHRQRGDEVFFLTVDPDHVAGVQEFIRRWIANDDVYLSKYEGLYCTRCEAFYEESELVDERGSRDGPHVRCPIHTSNADAIQRLNEENYFFRLSRYEQKLKDLYRDNPDFCVPEIRRNEVLGWLDRGLRDVSVSRRNLTWGIPFPDKPGHTVYVWFDALINYATGVGFGTDEKKFKKWWPCDVHVIGLDITRFHCIYWPAMLMSAGIELPRQVYAHGFLHYAGEGRLSRSSGNMIDPIAAANEWGSDALRYLLLREAPFAKDSPISPEILDLRFNADLANGLGNLVSRATKMVELYCEGRVPPPGKVGPSEKALRETAERALATHDASASKLDFADALGAIFGVVEEANKHFQRTQPWQAVKEPARKGEVEASLFAGLEAVRVVAYLLFPYMPTISPRIAEVLGVESPATAKWAAVARWALPQPGKQIHSAPSLFPRLERAKTA